MKKFSTRLLPKILRRLRHLYQEPLTRLRPRQISDRALLAAAGGRFASVAQLSDHLDRRTAPVFFPPFTAQPRHKWIAAFRAHFPQAEVAILQAADRAMAHTFDLLGSGPTPLGPEIDWHTDFKSGYRWDPRGYYAYQRPAPFPGGYDIKVPWELSRSQHLPWLGQAYWFSGDERYSREFVAQVGHWIQENPPGLGVNWACTMDVAIRVVNWLWGYYYFQGSPSLTPAFRARFWKSLLLHGRHIYRNLERHDLVNNHYLANLVGLVYLGALLPEFSEANRWGDFAWRELEREMLRQVLPDGVNFEASVAYHRLAAELFLSAAMLARANGRRLPPACLERLEKMLEVTLALTTPAGAVPLFGDNDNGRLHRLRVWEDPEREWHDHRYLLAIGAVFFQREDFARAAGDEWIEAAWLFGPEALAFRESFLPAATAISGDTERSAAFPDGGLYVLRCPGYHLTLDAGSTGSHGRGGHGHNDALSFALFAEGLSWIIDPGTCAYTGDYRRREQDRSTAAHNTALVDDLDQIPQDPQAPFSLPDSARPQVRAWVTGAEFDFWWASHAGYQRLPTPVVHHRQVYFEKGSQPFWLVRDLFAGRGLHRYTWNFHFNPVVQLDHYPYGLIVRRPTGRNLLIHFLNFDCQSEVYPGFYSPGYGVHQVSPAIKFSLNRGAPFEAHFLLRAIDRQDSMAGCLAENLALAAHCGPRIEALTREK